MVAMFGKMRNKNRRQEGKEKEKVKEQEEQEQPCVERGEDHINPDNNLGHEDREAVISKFCEITEMPRTKFVPNTPTAEMNEGDGFLCFLNLSELQKKRKEKKMRKKKNKHDMRVLEITKKIHKLAVYLCENLHVNELFSVKGDKSNSKTLKDRLNAGADVEAGVLQPHDAAHVLKSFLDELPEPLLMHAHFQAHMHIADMTFLDEEGNKTDTPDEQRQVEALQLLFQLLPKPNRDLLQLLLDLLNNTAKQSDQNIECCHRLAIEFAPRILSPNKKASKKQQGKIEAIVAFLIEHSERLFPESFSQEPLAENETLQEKDEMELLAAVQEGHTSLSACLEESAETEVLEPTDPTPVTPPSTPDLCEGTTCSEQEVPTVEGNHETAETDVPEPPQEMPVFKEDASVMAASPEPVLESLAVQLNMDSNPFTGHSPDATHEQTDLFEGIENQSVVDTSESVANTRAERLSVRELVKKFEPQPLSESVSKSYKPIEPLVNKPAPQSEPLVPVVEPSAISEETVEESVVHLSAECTPPVSLLEPVEKEELVAVDVDPTVESEDATKLTVIQMAPDLTSAPGVGDTTYDLTPSSVTEISMIQDNSVIASGPQPSEDLESKYQSVLTLKKIFEQEDPKPRENVANLEYEPVPNLKAVVEQGANMTATHELLVESEDAEKPTAVPLETDPAPLVDPLDAALHKQGDQETTAASESLVEPVVLSEPGASVVAIECTAAVTSPGSLAKTELAVAERNTALLNLKNIYEQELPRESEEVEQLKDQSVPSHKALIEESLHLEQGVQDESLVDTCLESEPETVAEPVNLTNSSDVPVLDDLSVVAPCPEISTESKIMETAVEQLETSTTAVSDHIVTVFNGQPLDLAYWPSPESNKVTPVSEPVVSLIEDNYTVHAIPESSTESEHVAQDPNPAPILIEPGITVVTNDSVAALNPEPCSEPVKEVVETKSASPEPSAEVVKAETLAPLLLKADPTPVTFHEPTLSPEPVASADKDGSVVTGSPEPSMQSEKLAKPASVQMTADLDPVSTPILTAKSKFQQLRQIYEQEDPRQSERTSKLKFQRDPEPSRTSEIPCPDVEVPAVENESVVAGTNALALESVPVDTSPEPLLESMEATTAVTKLSVIKLKRIFEKEDNSDDSVPAASSEPLVGSSKATENVNLEQKVKKIFEKEDSDSVPAATPESSVGSFRPTEPMNLGLTADFAPITAASAVRCSEPEDELAVQADPEPLAEAEEEEEEEAEKPPTFLQLVKLFNDKVERQSIPA